jgi:succinyl-CoA synthetase beta subunit
MTSILTYWRFAINGMFRQMLDDYARANIYVQKHKHGDITLELVSNTTRKKLFRHCMDLLTEMNKYRPVDITQFLKLKKLHLNQLKKLNIRFYKVNRIYLAKIESLFRKTSVNLKAS